MSREDFLQKLWKYQPALESILSTRYIGSFLVTSACTKPREASVYIVTSLRKEKRKGNVVHNQSQYHLYSNVYSFEFTKHELR